MNRRQRSELLFENAPDREGIEEHLAAVQGRHEHLRTKCLLDLLPKDIRNLQTSLLVEAGGSAAAKAIHSLVVSSRSSETGPLSPTFFQIKPLAAMLVSPTIVSQGKGFA